VLLLKCIGNGSLEPMVRLRFGPVTNLNPQIPSLADELVANISFAYDSLTQTQFKEVHLVTPVMYDWWRAIISALY